MNTGLGLLKSTHRLVKIDLCYYMKTVSIQKEDVKWMPWPNQPRWFMLFIGKSIEQNRTLGVR